MVEQTLVIILFTTLSDMHIYVVPEKKEKGKKAGSCDDVHFHLLMSNIFWGENKIKKRF